MKIYAYLRVSTDQQVESGAGLGAQVEACKRWAESTGQSISEVFSDEGISGSTGLDKRPGLMLAINALDVGDVLLVSMRDRLGRDPIAVAMIDAAVLRKGAKVVSAAGEGTGGNDPGSILMRRMIDAFAEFERNIIQGRTRAAMQSKKSRKERVGHIPFGFRLAEDGLHLETDELEHGILEQMRDLRREGYTVRKIASEMNRRGAFNRKQSQWNNGSVHRVLSRKAA